MSCWTGGHKVRLDHIWFTGLNGNTVTEIRPSDGDAFGKFSVGNQPTPLLSFEPVPALFSEHLRQEPTRITAHSMETIYGQQMAS